MKTNEILLLYRLLSDEIEKYKGLDTENLKSKLNITSKGKNVNSVISKKIIEYAPKADKIQKLLENCLANIKTVNLEWDNRLRESISLNVIRYQEIVNEEWINSSLRKFFL